MYSLAAAPLMLPFASAYNPPPRPPRQQVVCDSPRRLQKADREGEAAHCAALRARIGAVRDDTSRCAIRTEALKKHMDLMLKVSHACVSM